MQRAVGAAAVFTQGIALAVVVAVATLGVAPAGRADAIRFWIVVDRVYTNVDAGLAFTQRLTRNQAGEAELRDVLAHEATARAATARSTRGAGATCTAASSANGTRASRATSTQSSTSSRASRTRAPRARAPRAGARGPASAQATGVASSCTARAGSSART